MIRVGVDTGGTFSDFVVSTPDGITVFKRPSTPRLPIESVAAGLDELGIAEFELSHGTTVATNCILERKLARTAFVTNAGFEDLLTIARQTRRELYSFCPTGTPAPVPREDCYGIQCRTGADGSTLVHLDEDQIDRLAEQVAGYDAVAVCLLFGYANPADERRIRSALSNRYVSISSDVSPEFREYERACATAVNAGLSPRLDEYLGGLASIAGSSKTRVMASTGGLITVERARALPLCTAVSGPAAGVAATAALATKLRLGKCVAFDMGGTSTDVCLVDGTPTFTAEGDIGGVPIRLPRVDIHTIGCGGGSIAWLDDAGALRVGPESAGSDPGPALFGVGSRITVSDASFQLRRLRLECFGGGSKIRTTPDRVAPMISAMGERVGATTDKTAESIVAIADAQMAKAIRVVTSQRGLDPAECALVSYGGAGGMHACSIAEQLGIRKIVVPRTPGVFSAIGLLLAPDVVELAQTVLGTNVDPGRTISLLRERAESEIPNADRILCFADLRYKGQGYEIRTPVARTEDATEAEFTRLHEKRFGVRGSGSGVEWVGVRVRAERDSEPLDWDRIETASATPSIDFTDFAIWRGERVAARVLTRELAEPGLCGPAIVLQQDATTFLPPGWRIDGVESGALIIQRS